MKFANLYLQTEYSMLSSSIGLKSLMKISKDYGYTSLAITDNAMHGVIKFYKECLNAKIKPIIGLRVEVNEGTYCSCVLLYATSLIGYQNLMKISSYQAVNNNVTMEVLNKHRFDILAILPSDENEVLKLFKDQNYEQAKTRLDQYKQVFPNLYMGIDMQTSSMRSIVPSVLSFCKNNSLEAVAINKTNYLTEEDFEVYTTLRCIDLGLNNYAYTEKERYSQFLSVEEVQNLFGQYPELIQNTQEISNKCNLEISFGIYKLPKYHHENSKQFLIDLCKLGLNKRLKNRQVNQNAYKNRLFYELQVIEKMGFSDYFLIVYDYVKYAKQHNILVGPGRGSAPGSLVSYCLGITDIDPMAFDLLFERFLNPERISMPDIDVDFPDNRRDEVIRYLGERFGKMQVAHITTFGTFGPRMAIRDVARVLRINEMRLNIIIKNIPSLNPPPLSIIASENEEIKAMIMNDQEVHKLFLIASKLEGIPRHTSTHAAGIIMADRDLVDYTPLQNGINGLFQTQYEASDLESLGLVKMDILGLKNLTIIKNVLDKIKTSQNINLDINSIPLDDPLVYKMIANGDTDGIFQLESKGMRKVLMNLKTTNFMDIVHANALFRPGPMEMIPDFIKGKFGGQAFYIHEDLKEILAPTYGIIVFQEQIMLIAQKFAGYSLGMADILRRAVSKKNSEVLENERLRFVRSAMNKGYSQALSNQVYDYIVKFANYGFNKNHSVAYSLIAYQMSYLKVHYYIYFMAVLMSNSIGNTVLIHAYVNHCRHKKVNIHLPSVNYSSNDFEVGPDGIYYSLLGLVGIGNVIVKQLLEEREAGYFTSYEEFVFRTSHFMNKKLMSSFVFSGALDEFGLTRRQMIETYDEVNEKKGFLNILGNKIVKNEKQYDEYSFDEISILEKEVLGFNLKYDMFIKFQPLKNKEKTTNLNMVQVGSKIKILFIIRKIKRINTKKGDEMAFLDIYDDTSSLDAVLFPKSYTQVKPILNEGLAYIGIGSIDERDGKKQVILESVYSVK